MTLYEKDNLIKVNYGQWGFRRSSGSVHRGADVSTATAPYAVRCVAGGCVEFAGAAAKTAADPNTWEWGWHVRVYADQSDAVRRTGTRRMVYAHCADNSLRVRTGQGVAAGQVLGTMGDSGNAAQDSQGRHCHFQVDEWNGSAWVNVAPAPYIGGGNTAGAVWYGEAEGVVMMKALDVFGAERRNVQGFGSPDVNDVVLNGIANGRYMVYETGVALGGGLTGAACRVDGQRVYVALLDGATELTDIAVEDAEARWKWYAACGNGVAQADYDAVKADRDARQKRGAAALAYVRQVQEAAAQAEKTLLG